MLSIQCPFKKGKKEKRAWTVLCSSREFQVIDVKGIQELEKAFSNP